MAQSGHPLDSDYAYCAKLVRQRDPDRYFATLFAPANKRPHLFALYAFSAEIAHVQEVTREPLAGQIRLQWWRDVLDKPEAGATSPVAAALNATIDAFGLPRSAFQNLIDARVRDVYSEPIPDVNQLEGYCGDTCSVLFQMAAMLLAGATVNSAEAAGHGGVAYAVAGLIRAFPWHARSGKLYVPLVLMEQHGASPDKVVEGEDGEAVRQALRALGAVALVHLERAETVLAGMPAAAKTAFLPLTLVRPYLKLMKGENYQPFASVLDLPQWRKQWILWRKARRQ